VCANNSDSDVLVMQAADQSVRHDASDLLAAPLFGGGNGFRNRFVTRSLTLAHVTRMDTCNARVVQLLPATPDLVRLHLRIAELRPAKRWVAITTDPSRSMILFKFTLAFFQDERNSSREFQIRYL
jgi:hypothetical protein